jgi:S1-C subfamily serine protease
VEVPGSPPDTAWAAVTFDQGRCYLSNLGAPCLVITRKVSGELRAIPVERGGEAVETKSHDLVSFAVGGPSLYCRYELDLELFGFKVDDLPEAVSPLSAERRRQDLDAHSVPQRHELAKVEETAEAARERASQAARAAGKVDRKFEAERRREGGRRLALVAGGLAVAACLTVAGLWALRGVESRLERGLAGLSAAVSNSQSDYQSNEKRLASIREEGKSELARLQEELRKIEASKDGGSAALGEVRKQMEALRTELRERTSLEEKFARMQKDVEGAVFFIATELTVSEAVFPGPDGLPSNTMWGTGTGFMADREGRMVTCKHVVEPWKFPQMAALLAKAKVRITGCRLEAYPAGYRFTASSARSAGVLYSTDNGKLKVVGAAPDDLRRTTEMVLGEAVECEAESNYENDVAILQIQGSNLKPLRLATDEEMSQLSQKKLWPVMVAGFPLGLKIFDNGEVATSMTLGNIRRFGKFVYHSAPTCVGNSGGPLIDEEGRVLGIVSFVVSGDSVQNLNACVPITHANRLLRGRAGH